MGKEPDMATYAICRNCETLVVNSQHCHKCGRKATPVCIEIAWFNQRDEIRRLGHALDKEIEARAKAEAQRDVLANEVKRLQVALLDAKQEIFLALAQQVRDGPRAGRWDTLCMSGACVAGDALVKAGRFERHPDGYGRRWFYRPVAATATETHINSNK
jgi:hypothetical protein